MAQIDVVREKILRPLGVGMLSESFGRRRKDGHDPVRALHRDAVTDLQHVLAVPFTRIGEITFTGLLKPFIQMLSVLSLTDLEGA